MHRFDTVRTIAAAAGALFVASSAPAEAQSRTVVSNSIVVSGDEASLHLEFSEGQLELSFARGAVRIGDEVRGRYEAGGAADRAWRELLAEALPLANGPLAQRLLEWSPPESLPLADREVLAGVDQALEDALRVPGAAAGAGRLEAAGDFAAGVIEGAQVEGFWEAVNYATKHVGDQSFMLVANQDHEVAAGTSQDRGLLIAGGRLDVYGTVRGGVVAVDGTVAVHEGAQMLGNVHLLESRLERHGGVIRGAVVDVQMEIRRAEERERDRLRAQLRRELREASADVQHERRRRGPSFFGRIGGVLGGVMEKAFWFVVLAPLAVVATKLSGVRGDVVAKAAAHNPAKSVAVGLAGAFLALPAYVLGIVTLAITIVGIPGLLVWAPLFPVAVVAVTFAGFVAASRNVGRWILDRNMSLLERADRCNPVHLSLVGIGALLLPYAAAEALEVLPLVGWTSNLVRAAACFMVFATAVAGLGAVITTRGGKNASAGWGFEDDFEAAAWSSRDDFASAKASGDAQSGGAEAEPESAEPESSAEDGAGGAREPGESKRAQPAGASEHGAEELESAQPESASEDAAEAPAASADDEARPGAEKNE